MEMCCPGGAFTPGLQLPKAPTSWEIHNLQHKPNHYCGEKWCLDSYSEKVGWDWKDTSPETSEIDPVTKTERICVSSGFIPLKFGINFKMCTNLGAGTSFFTVGGTAGGWTVTGKVMWGCEYAWLECPLELKGGSIDIARTLLGKSKNVQRSNGKTSAFSVSASLGIVLAATEAKNKEGIDITGTVYANADVSGFNKALNAQITLSGSIVLRSVTMDPLKIKGHPEVSVTGQGIVRVFMMEYQMLVTMTGDGAYTVSMDFLKNVQATVTSGIQAVGDTYISAMDEIMPDDWKSTCSTKCQKNYPIHSNGYCYKTAALGVTCDSFCALTEAKKKEEEARGTCCPKTCCMAHAGKAMNKQPKQCGPRRRIKDTKSTYVESRRRKNGVVSYRR